MKLGLGVKTTINQTLTPQQIQYLKLLQLPMMQLEQQVRQEIEMNPMLEDSGDELDDFKLEQIDKNLDKNNPDDYKDLDKAIINDGKVVDSNDYEQQALYMDDKPEQFEFQKMLWEGTSNSEYNPNKSPDENDDNDSFQIKDNLSFNDDLNQQLSMILLSKEEKILGDQIIGNIDDDGYLRRDLNEIVDETNQLIAQINYENTVKKDADNLKIHLNGNGNAHSKTNPAKLYTLSYDSARYLDDQYEDEDDFENMDLSPVKTKKKVIEKFVSLNLVSIDQAEKVLNEIRHLDPPGIGARNLQECLLAQLKMIKKPNAAQKLAMEILDKHYNAFIKKHYHHITKNLNITDDYLKESIEEIRALNPKPGGGDYQNEINTVIPDFSIEKSEEGEDLIININDSRMPSLQLSKAYSSMRKEAAYKQYNKDTRNWIRQKREDAKFLIQAIKQRKTTMLKVMTAIAHLQRNFFDEGSSALKPLIYKNVADETGLDISTVCRIVNGKYVQTPFGTHELKYFFSESLPSDDGEDVSTKVIKEALKGIISKESKQKPYSDDKLSKELKTLGYNVARRTVAKYREQMYLPVARLRKEL